MTSDTQTIPRWGPVDALGLWVLQFVGSGLWIAFLVAVFYDNQRPDPVPLTLIVIGQIVLWATYGLGPILVTRLKGNGPIIDLRATARVRDFPIGAVAGALLNLFVLPVVYWPILRLVEEDPGQTAEELVDQADSRVTVALLVLLVVIAAPLFEEFFFRGLLLHGLLQKLSPMAAVLTSSVAFALVHIQPILFPGTFLVGLAAGYATVKTGRLGLAWGIHLGFNAATLVLLLFDLRFLGS